MKRLLVTIVAAGALAFAATAGAALVPGVFDPGQTGCVTSSYSNGVLHLAKNCATSTNAAAGADITGVAGQTFTSASFTLANASQCQGGSPRFDIVVGTKVFFLGCNNVTPTVNANGSATYTFTADTIAAAGNQVPVPTGAIDSMDILIDVQGTADVSQITVNGTLETPAPVNVKKFSQCKNGGWKTFTSPKFKNQGQCVSYFAHQLNHAKQEQNAHHKHHH
jgi:hypothetical protein